MPLYRGSGDYTAKALLPAADDMRLRILEPYDAGGFWVAPEPEPEPESQEDAKFTRAPPPLAWAVASGMWDDGEQAEPDGDGGELRITLHCGRCGHRPRPEHGFWCRLHDDQVANGDTRPAVPEKMLFVQNENENVAAAWRASDGARAEDEENNGAGQDEDKGEDDEFRKMLQAFAEEMKRELSWEDVQQPRFASLMKQWEPEWLGEATIPEDSLGRNYDPKRGYKWGSGIPFPALKYGLPCVRCGGATSLAERKTDDNWPCSMQRLRKASPWLPPNYGAGVDSLTMGQYGKCHRCRLVVGIG